MKILKIFGIVVGIHVFALILIFANPGCSSTTKPPPSPEDTIARAEPAPMVTAPSAAALPAASELGAPVAAIPASFNPDAPATGSGGIRFTPTRPNTPAASAVQAAPVENVTPASTYTVKPGDSLWTLQKKFHVSYKEIAAANNLKTSATLHEGQKLIIPSKATSTAAAPAAASSTGPRASPVSRAETALPAAAPAATSRGNGEDVKYTVKPGDTLGGIARKFDVRTRDLAVANNISDPLKLKPGAELTIPGWRSPAGKSARPAASAEPSKPAPVEPAPTTPSPAPVIEMDQPASQPAQPAIPVIRLDEGAPASNQP